MAETVTPFRPPGWPANQPPEPEILPPEEIIIDPQDPEILRARLARDHADLMRRFVELEQGAARIPAVKTEADAQRIVDFVAQQCRSLTTEAKQIHDREKKPFLQCSRVVDDFFLRRIEKFGVVIAQVSGRAELFYKRKKAEQRQREDEQRRRAAVEAHARAEEAARLEREAKKIAAADRSAAVRLGLQAQEAADRSAAAQAIVDAPPAPTRIHGDFGAVAFEKTRWRFEVVDPTQIPLGYLKPDDDAINAAIADGVREIPGIEIFEDHQFQIRRC
jgi:FtsZ-interacting cell division protein YlmF